MIAQLQHLKSDHIFQKTVRNIELFSSNDDQKDEEIVRRPSRQTKRTGNQGHKGGNKASREELGNQQEDNW